MSEKSHVGMLHDLCPVCGNQNGETSILLDKQLRKSLEKDNYQMGDLCESCKEMQSEGYIAMIVVDNPVHSNSGEHLKYEDANRTGDIVHMKRDACLRIFGPDFNTSLPFVFIDEEAAEMLKTMMNSPYCDDQS